jgi:hypothetical protein
MKKKENSQEAIDEGRFSTVGSHRRRSTKVDEVRRPWSRSNTISIGWAVEANG